ncbi:MAG: hypothetical protein IPM40_17235 [Gammaproteobacteria bacterium]|nr:hypothetical protein [Gammaproteobacteria bacterium]
MPARIAAGEIETAIVVGARRFRALQAQIAGTEAAETPFDEAPDEVLTPQEELQLPLEIDSGLGMMPVGYYALVESAFRAAQGLGVAEHRDRLAAMYSRFSEIAADNPHAWKRERLAAAEIRDATPRNRMLAFPYTRLHNTSWNVDQAAALLLCSAARAEALGIARAAAGCFRARARNRTTCSPCPSAPRCTACRGRASPDSARWSCRGSRPRRSTSSSCIPASRSRWNSTLRSSASRPIATGP